MGIRGFPVEHTFINRDGDEEWRTGWDSSAVRNINRFLENEPDQIASTLEYYNAFFGGTRTITYEVTT